MGKNYPIASGEVFGMDHENECSTDNFEIGDLWIDAIQENP